MRLEPTNARHKFRLTAVEIELATQKLHFVISAIHKNKEGKEVQLEVAQLS